MAFPGDGKGTQADPYKITNLFLFMESFSEPNAYFEFKNGLTFEYCSRVCALNSINVNVNSTKHRYTYSEDNYKFRIIDPNEPIKY